MTHDPLCPNFRLEDDCTCKPRNGEHDMRCACWDCECDIIAKVRADERKRVANYLRDEAVGPTMEAEAWAFAYAEAIDAMADKP